MTIIRVKSQMRFTDEYQYSHLKLAIFVYVCGISCDFPLSRFCNYA